VRRTDNAINRASATQYSARHANAGQCRFNRSLTGPTAADRTFSEFGAHDVNRVQFSVGRDLQLNPAQHGDRVNYLIFPYVELGGEPWPNVANAFSFTDVGSNEQAQRAAR